MASSARSAEDTSWKPPWAMAGFPPPLPPKRSRPFCRTALASTFGTPDYTVTDAVSVTDIRMHTAPSA